MPAAPLRQTADHLSPRRWLGLLVAAVLALYLAWGLYRSVADILSYDDFEVYHYIGTVAAYRTDNIYELTTPHQQRGPFLYSPAAAVLFVPLSWLSHDVSGVIFAVVKMACLGLLWWGSVRFSGRRPSDLLGALLCMLATTIMLHRAVASDIGNGQINIMVAAAAAGGIWLIVLARRWWWLGSVLLAWAIAIKMTPALLLAIPVLHRKWKGLLCTVGVCVVAMLVVPVAWFGPDAYQKMSGQHRQIAARFTFDWSAAPQQISPTELFQFVRLQTNAARPLPPDVPEVLSVPISGDAGRGLFDPLFRPPAVRFWLALGFASGITFLLVRWWLIQHRAEAGADWTWDLAMLCTLIVWLSPRVQDAHLVILIVPAGWLAARICAWFAPGRAPAISCRPIAGILGYVLLCAIFLIAQSASIPVGGWDEQARCLPLVGLIGMLAMIVVVGWIDSRAALPFAEQPLNGSDLARRRGGMLDLRP